MASGVIQNIVPKIYLYSTLTGDVLSVVKNANVGISYYKNSNNPTNQPLGHSWGAYVIFKEPTGFASVLYMDTTGIACSYSLDSASESISWHIA